MVANPFNVVDLHLPGRHNQARHGWRSGEGNGASAGDTGGVDAKGIPLPRKGAVAARLLGDARDLQALHSRPGKKPGDRVYSASRKKTHDSIVRSVLAGHAPQAEKRALFTAGGPGSGKSTVVATRPELTPLDAVRIDPDLVKEHLPEYRQMAASGDPYAGAAAHPESADIAWRAYDEATAKDLNLVVDGSGNSGPGEFAQALRNAHEAGYGVSLVYVDVPTSEALERAENRAQEQGRHIHEGLVRKMHTRVSANFPEVAALDFVDDIRLYDNSATPRLIARGGYGKIDVLDSDAYERFLAKAGAKKAR